MNLLDGNQKWPPEDSDLSTCLQRAGVKCLGSPRPCHGTPASNWMGSISGNFLENVCSGCSHRMPLSGVTEDSCWPRASRTSSYWGCLSGTPAPGSLQMRKKIHGDTVLSMCTGVLLEPPSRIQAAK